MVSCSARLIRLSNEKRKREIATNTYESGLLLGAEKDDHEVAEVKPSAIRTRLTNGYLPGKTKDESLLDSF